MRIPARATHPGDLELDPLEVRPGQALTGIQNFDADEAAALVESEDDPRAHFFRRNDRFCNRKPTVKPLPFMDTISYLNFGSRTHSGHGLSTVPAGAVVTPSSTCSPPSPNAIFFGRLANAYQASDAVRPVRR